MDKLQIGEKDFIQLILSIEQVHEHLQAKAVNAVNQTLTIRNWLIGYYIVEFEQEGKNRAEYGKRLLVELAKKLAHIKGMDERSFRRFRQFYQIYPQLNSEHLDKIIEEPTGYLQVPPSKIISKLSYSHIELLLNLDNPLKHVFYELECIKSTWSVRELKRQINSSKTTSKPS